MWCLDVYLDGGRRQRRFFASKEEAETAERDLARNRKRAGDDWLGLSVVERTELMLVRAEVLGCGLTLRRVWDEYRRLAGDEVSGASARLGDVVAECVGSKRAANRRPSYVATLASFLADFSGGREAVPVASITARDIMDWLDDHKGWSPSSKATAATRVSTLFAYAVRRGYMTRNPCDALERRSVELAPPAIMTADECASSVAWVRRHWPAALGWFALCLFAGVRPEEADRITWADVEFADGILTVSAAASKVRRRRIVHLVPSALHWLREAKRLNPHLPVSKSTRRRAARGLRGHLGWKDWPKDVLRHTAASCLLALWRDPQRVSLELGNSPKVLMQHYHELVRKPDAERWFSMGAEVT